MVWQRIASAVVAAPILIAAVWVGGPVFTALISAAAVFAALEFFSLVGKAGSRPAMPVGLVLALAFVGNAYFSQSYTAPLLTATVAVPLLWMLWRQQYVGVVSDWAITIAGVLYTGWLLSLFVALRNQPDGLGWTALTALATFACDTGAFAVGSLWGRHKLMPRVSPGKTIEGAAGGLVGALAVTAIVAWLFALPVGFAGSLVLGLVLALFAQFGDLAESMVKRGLQVKDASKLIPGHGGILDRVDSLGFAVIVVYFWTIWVIV